jgi:DNA polymerase IV (DinB-like DNA polymerase)
MDYFYAQVEQRSDPSLADRPVVVGQYSGRTKDSGVVATTNYVAREFGVKSGIPITRAMKLLEGKDAVFLKANHQIYESVSEDVMRILREKSNSFESVSVDEAYLDITPQTTNFDTARKIALEIKEQIRDEVGLTCSIGVGHNKLIAKMASDFRKPDGLTIIGPEEVRSFLSSIPLRRLFGVGEKTESKLRGMGIETIEQLANFDPISLLDTFGTKFGTYLHLAANGEDNEKVQERETREQIGRLSTLKSNTRDLDQMRKVLEDLAESVHGQIRDENLSFKSVSITAIMEDLKIQTRTKTLEAIDDALPTIQKIAYQLLRNLLEENEDKEVRRIGVKVSNLIERDGQLSLTDFAE